LKIASEFTYCVSVAAIEAEFYLWKIVWSSFRILKRLVEFIMDIGVSWFKIWDFTENLFFSIDIGVWFRENYFSSIMFHDLFDFKSISETCWPSWWGGWFGSCVGWSKINNYFGTFLGTNLNEPIWWITSVGFKTNTSFLSWPKDSSSWVSDWLSSKIFFVLFFFFDDSLSLYFNVYL